MRRRERSVAPRILDDMDTPTPPAPLTDEELADARATRLLIRLGIGALVLLVVWIVIVLIGFM